jgi:signal transduction histidine kinase
MRLSTFLQTNTKQIISEWENFALTLVSSPDSASPLALRDHIESLLRFIADDIESTQTKTDQKKKSRGQAPKQAKHSAAEIHASIRLAGGFNMDQMVSEYRALRASVIQLWETEKSITMPQDICDMIRFNESIDQQLTESIRHYTKKLDYAHDLFLGILSHDMRNPIGAANMSAQLVLKIGGLTERQEMLAVQVLESTNRAMEIVMQLLDLTRARLGSGLPIVREIMDMGFVSRVLVDEMRALHPDNVINLKISGDMEGDWDKPRIGKVFSNLLGNAVQYGFRDVPIEVTVKGTEHEVSVSVHNDGVPIPPWTIGKIFESLTRGGENNSTDKSESTNLGLGLYITKEIVTAHGGTIGVTSTEKDGTMFTARFPRNAQSPIQDVDSHDQGRILNLVVK